MKNIIGLLVCLAIIGSSVYKNRRSPLSDDEIRSRVVQLKSLSGGCTGEQITAPSGENYILSAAHCRPLANPDGSIMVITEDGRVLERKVIAEDSNSDLLLIEGVPGVKGLRIGDKLERFEDVRTFTHGKLLPTYQTHGQVIGDQMVYVGINEIGSASDEEACTKMAKNKVYDGIFGKLCMLAVEETAVTAMIVPGSSGGPIVNDMGDLVGVASASDGQLGYLVTLKHIKAFVSNY